MLEFESHFSASTTPIVETLGFLCFNLVFFYFFYFFINLDIMFKRSMLKLHFCQKKHTVEITIIH